MSSKDTKLYMLIALLVTTLLFNLTILPTLVTYLDASDLPYLLRFAIYELGTAVAIFLFISIVFHKFNLHKHANSIAISIAAWCVYHVLDWLEAPWALGVNNEITKTAAFSVSADTASASLLCNCVDAGAKLVCNSGCFNAVTITVPILLVIIALLLTSSKSIQKILQR
jgi:hypothetical protein